MPGIKGVLEILKPFRVVALFAPVQPDGHQRQQRQTLLNHQKRMAEKSNGIGVASQHFHMDPVEANCLPQKARKVPAPEEIKYQYR